KTPKVEVPKEPPATGAPTPASTAAATAPEPTPAPEAVSGLVENNSSARPEPVPAAGGALAFSSEMTRPERVEWRAPAYTREALAARVEGTVIARCVISEQGVPERCKLIKSLVHMDKAVLESLASARYKPATLAGKPVAVEYLITL